jgi:hypothetical protein
MMMNKQKHAPNHNNTSNNNNQQLQAEAPALLPFPLLPPKDMACKRPERDQTKTENARPCEPRLGRCRRDTKLARYSAIKRPDRVQKRCRTLARSLSLPPATRLPCVQTRHAQAYTRFCPPRVHRTTGNTSPHHLQKKRHRPYEDGHNRRLHAKQEPARHHVRQGQEDAFPAALKLQHHHQEDPDLPSASARTCLTAPAATQVSCCSGVCFRRSSSYAKERRCARRSGNWGPGISTKHP